VIGRRARCWVLAAGLLAAAGSVSPSVDALADRTLAAHMAQHLVLTMVAPPLIMIGSPIALALRLAPRRTARRLAGLHRNRLVRALTAPALAWSLLPAVQLAVHLTPLFELAERNQLVHAAEHLALFASALLFWRPLVGADPLRRITPLAQIGYLLSAMPANDVVGVWLMSSSHVRYASYAADGLAGQRRAGVVMLAGAFPLAVAALSTAWTWARRDHHRAVLREQLQ
jgi:putative membrane protein